MVVYDSVDMSPLDTPRRLTNKKSFIFFAVCMIAYVIVAINAFVSGDFQTAKQSIDDDFIKTVKEILDKLFEAKWLIAGYLVFSAVSMMVCLCITRALSRIIIKIAIVLECIFFVLNVISLILSLKTLDPKAFFNQLIMTLLNAWSVYVKVYVVQKVGTKLMSKIVKEATRVIFMFPGTMALSVIIALLVFVELVFGISVFAYLLTVKNKSSFLYTLYHFVNLYCTVWLFSATLCFGSMVFCGTYGTWFWTMEKSSVPDDATLRNLAAAFQYHIGTIAYMSSPWIIIRLLITMFKGLNARTYQSRHSIFVMIVCWFNVFTKILDGSIAVTAIHGKSFNKAADIACQLYLRFPVRLYAITKAYEWCASVMLLVSSIIITVVAISLNPSSQEKDQIYLMVAALLICLVIVIVPLAIILDAAVVSIFFCILEDFERDQEDRNRRCFMKQEIKDLMLEVEE